MDIQGCIDPKIIMLKLSELTPDDEQPREYFDPDRLADLKNSIQASGIITPLLYRDASGKKIIVSGEYRYRAAKELGLDKVPAQLVLRDYQIVALSENIQRNSLTAMEEARGVKRLLDLGMDRKEIMHKLGKAENTISEMLKPTELPEEMQKEALTSAFWSRNKLLMLAKLKGKKQQDAFVKMKAAVDKKEAAKKQKREKGPSGSIGKGDTKTKSTKGESGTKHIVFNSRVSKFHDRIKKEIGKKWITKDKDKLKKELDALIKTIEEFLSK